MIRKIRINEPEYGRYFLFSEAPKDEENPKVETRDVTPKNDENDTDFNNLTDEDYENLTLDDGDDDEMDTDFNDLGLDDINEDELDDQNENPDDTNFNNMNDDKPENPNPNENQNTGTNDDMNNPPENNGGEEMNTTDNPENTDNPDEMDTNFNDDNLGTDDGTGMDGDGMDNGDETSTDNTPKGPGVEYDSTRKYVLYQKFMSLHNALGNYISKLENSTRDDIGLNQVLKISTNKLRDLKNLTFEYMTMKFKASTYVQSLLFYQQLIVSTQLVFKTIATADKEYKNKSNKK